MKSKIILLTTILSFLAACGGGGGGGVTNVSGTYRTSNFLVLNTCGIEIADTANQVLTVNQDSNNVVVSVSGGGTFAGQILDNGFNYVRLEESNGCVTGTIGEITEISDNTAESSLRLEVECSNGDRCEIAYVGNAERF